MAATINADNGVVSGSSGLKSTADTSGVLALQSNGTTGLTLNTSLALGVGSGNSTGSSGQVLTSAGSAAAPTWATVSSAQTLTINSSTTLSAGNQYLVDTSLNTVTVTLPASPSTGNTVAIYDANYMFGNNSLTINPNGSTLAFRSGNVVVNSSGRNIFLRYNGTTWVSEVIPSPDLPQVSAQSTTYSITGGWTVQTGMGFGSGLFVGLTTNTYAITSPDGITWTQRTLPSVKNWISVAYGNGTFVAVSGAGSFSTSAAYSSDGTTWTASTCELGKWQSVAFGNGVFTAVATSTSTAQTSTNGITWTARTMALSSTWGNIVYGNGVFVAQDDGSAGTTNFNTSPDGVTWTASGALSINTGCIAYGNGIFVCLPYSGNLSAISSDGLVWQTVSNNLPFSGPYNKIVFCNGTFFGFKSSSTNYIYSNDGRSWMRGTLAVINTGAAAVGNGVIATLNSTASTGNQLRII